MSFLQGKLDGNAECQQFIDAIVPEAFRKVNNAVLDRCMHHSIRPFQPCLATNHFSRLLMAARDPVRYLRHARTTRGSGRHVSLPSNCSYYIVEYTSHGLSSTLVHTSCTTTPPSLQTFDTSTTFSQKHKDEPLPSRRVYTLNDEVFVRNSSQKGSYGWLRSIIQRVSSQPNDLAVRRSICSSSPPRMVSRLFARTWI